MKVVILCGGLGTRLREETEYKPKALVEIGGMPILWHIMKIYSHFGYKEFIICLGYKGSMIKEYFLNFEELANDFTLKLRSNESRVIHHQNVALEDWTIHFIDTGLDSNTGARIAKIKEHIGEDEDFFLTYGDGVSDVDINDLYKFHKKNGKVVTLTAINPVSPYGIIEAKDGKVISFKEKPRLHGLINGGFFVCNKKVFNYLNDDPSCIFEEDPLKKLTKEGKLAAYQFNGFWYAIDTYKHVNHLNELWKTNPQWKVW